MDNITHVYFDGLGIDFDLPSVAFSVFGYQIHWYGIVIAFGFALAVLYGGRGAWKWKMSLDGMVDVLIWGTIFGIIGAIVTVLGLVTANALTAVLGISYPMVGMIIAVISAVLMIVAGGYGLGASKDPAKAKTAMIIGILMIVLAIIAIIVNVNETNAIVSQITQMAAEMGAGEVPITNVGGLSWTNFTGLIMPILYCLAAFLFRKKAQA